MCDAIRLWTNLDRFTYVGVGGNCHNYISGIIGYNLVAAEYKENNEIEKGAYNV